MTVRKTSDIVLKGKLTYRYTDGSEETIGQGEAYYARPGHTPFYKRAVGFDTDELW